LIDRQAGELPLANRTQRRDGVGLGLRSTLQGRTQQVLDIPGGLHFKVTQILIVGQRATLDGLFQGATRTGRKHGQGFAHRNTRALAGMTISACRINAP